LTTIERSALVHYSPQEMFQLVNNVGDYAEFLPWCRSSRVITETETEMEASVEIAKGVLNQTFTTRNTLTRGHRIDIALVNGPFKKLSGYWQFDALKTENASKVNLVLEFEFDNTMISIAARPVFTQIVNSLVDAFTKRAVEVYGERG
jgi:ribosome-associated toxin RatA of RatAB toxin-antitoxin module